MIGIIIFVLYLHWSLRSVTELVGVSQQLVSSNAMRCDAMLIEMKFGRSCFPVPARMKTIRNAAISCLSVVQHLDYLYSVKKDKEISLVFVFFFVFILFDFAVQNVNQCLYLFGLSNFNMIMLYFIYINI